MDPAHKKNQQSLNMKTPTNWPTYHINQGLYMVTIPASSRVIVVVITE